MVNFAGGKKYTGKNENEQAALSFIKYCERSFARRSKTSDKIY